jgi:uncharacterized membrane protein YphA (DoxX/SURF4 family)
MTSLLSRLAGGSNAAWRDRWPAVQPWVSTVARLVLGVVWIVAGLSKADDLAASVRAVRAYQLLPDAAAEVVGAGLPFAEIALGLLLVAGLGTRAAAIATGVLMAVFVVGIVSAWSRGLRIDCGCFGEGGELGAGEEPAYPWETLRDGGLFVLAVLLAWWPRSRFAVDGWLYGPQGDEEDR